MKTENFNDVFFARMREEEVWKKLSEDYVNEFIWTEALLERYQDKVDWKLLSGNRTVQWTGSMLEKFKDMLDWDALSENSSERLFSKETLRKYRAYWNWTKLSENSYIPWSMELIEEFKDDIDWEAFADRYYYGSSNEAKVDPRLIFEKYQNCFSASKFMKSNLWKAVLERDMEEVVKKILS
jgi:fido (protein-threonine AMPylation protein)